jgi:hypothetical protein
MPHLYDYSQTFINLVALLDDESCTTDEILEVAINAESDFVEKAKNVAIWIKNNEGDIEAFGKETKRLQDRKTTLENKTKWLKAYLQREMEKTGIRKIDGIVPISFRKCPSSVEIVDPSLIPTIYLKPHEPEFDKRTILDILKSGNPITGAKLVFGKETLKIG